MGVVYAKGKGSRLCLMSPSGSAEMEGTYWHAMLKLIHLDHECVPVCLGARGRQGYWQSSSLQRAQVISMLSLPFETWFPYSLSAKVTRLGETASRLARWKATSKPFLEFFSLFALISPLPLCLHSATGEVGVSWGWRFPLWEEIVRIMHSRWKHTGAALRVKVATQMLWRHYAVLQLVSLRSQKRRVGRERKKKKKNIPKDYPGSLKKEQGLGSHCGLCCVNCRHGQCQKS